MSRQITIYQVWDCEDPLHTMAFCGTWSAAQAQCRHYESPSEIRTRTITLSKSGVLRALNNCTLANTARAMEKERR